MRQDLGVLAGDGSTRMRVAFPQTLDLGLHVTFLRHQLLYRSGELTDNAADVCEAFGRGLRCRQEIRHRLDAKTGCVLVARMERRLANSQTCGLPAP
eukprot:12935406-Prorocentrum_lima.AAC.1